MRSLFLVLLLSWRFVAVVSFHRQSLAVIRRLAMADFLKNIEATTTVSTASAKKNLIPLLSKPVS